MALLLEHYLVTSHVAMKLMAMVAGDHAVGPRSDSHFEPRATHDGRDTSVRGLVGTTSDPERETILFVAECFDGVGGRRPDRRRPCEKTGEQLAQRNGYRDCGRAPAQLNCAY